MDFILGFFELIPLVFIDYFGSDGLSILVVGSFFLFLIAALILSIRMTRLSRTEKKNGPS